LYAYKKGKKDRRYLMACIRERRGRLVIDFYDQHGKRRWKTLKEGIAKREARKELREIEEKIEKGSYVAPRKTPGFSEITEMYLKAKKPNIRYSTYRNYVGHFENHLKPYFGTIKITRINYNSIERFIQRCQKKEVSIPTLRKILRTLGAIMTYSCKKRYIDYNPIRDIEKPKGQSIHNEDKEIAIIIPLQIRALLDAESDLKYKTLFMVTVMTGMRQGEILGLQWDDIDWVTNQVQVKRTFTSGRFYDPKSKASKRKIDLAPQLIAQLKKWQLACPSNKIGLVFPNEDGKPIESTSLVKRKFLPALKKAAIPRIRFHDLRHTYASLLIDQGENPKYIQAQLGHSSINMTFDIYGHLMKNINPQAASKLGDAIFNTDENKNVYGSKMVANTKKGINQNG
jgi:integrase